MNAQQTTVVIQLNDEQWEDVREILKDSLAGAIERLEQQAHEMLHRLEARTLALAKGSDVLVTRREAGHILGVGEDSVDKARLSGELPAARFRGRFALAAVLAFAAANDNDSKDD